ncbi:MAG: riboflavin synthase [Dissulfurispiraceae bacterium]
MFTGLILEVGEVASIEKKNQSAQLLIKGKEILEDILVGDSIAINGVCLTAISIKRDIITFDVSFETLRSTNLGELKRGHQINLEPSLKANSKIGGHFVTGHVEDIGSIRSKTSVGNALKIEVAAPASVLKYLVRKGAVAVDGISLTVVDVLKEAFTVMIVPHTAKMTTLAVKRNGDTVNLEPDILAKYVTLSIMRRQDSSSGNEETSSGGLSPDEHFMSTLKESGFTT